MNRPGFRSRKPGRFLCAEEYQGMQTLPPDGAWCCLQFFGRITSTLPLPAFAGTESIRRALPTVAAWNMAVRFGLSYHKEASAGQTVEKMLKAFWSPLCLKRTNLPEDRAEGEPWMILAFSRGERGRIGGFGAKEQMFAQDNTLQTFAYNKEILPKAGGLEQFKGEKKE